MDGTVLSDWQPRQLSGLSKVLYVKRMFRELFLYLIYLTVLTYGMLCIFEHLNHKLTPADVVYTLQSTVYTNTRAVERRCKNLAF